MAGGAEDPLKSHRREITVVYLDLRGFTAFAETAEPDSAFDGPLPEGGGPCMGLGDDCLASEVCVADKACGDGVCKPRPATSTPWALPSSS